MNIQDVGEVFTIPETTLGMLRNIFQRQEELREKYHKIEERNGFHCGMVPLNINDKHDQHRMKDMAWRIVEELAEATELGVTTDHRNEELVDALHFLVELVICIGIPYTDLDKTLIGDGLDNPYAFNKYYGGFITELGLSMNCLKNKPWKQTQMNTDWDKFRLCIARTWVTFWNMLFSAGLSTDQIYCLYFKKSEVNKFRQRSNY